MYAFLLALGVIVGAIGIFAIGFGIPIHEFSFGNTLIVAGEPEAVPLAPTRMPAPGHPAPMPEPAADPKLASSDLMARLSNLAAPPRPAVRPEPPRPAPAAPRPNMFDSVWPAEVRAARV